MTASDLVIMGASWGGLRAVGAVLAGLPADFGVPVLVVQHRAEDGSDRLTGLLDRTTALTVREADDKSSLEPGTVLVAPAGFQVHVEEGHVALSVEERVRNSRPSIDIALQSAAQTYGTGLIGVVLTGANDDGAAGLAAVRRHGGIAIVQDPEDAEQAAMPAAAVAQADPQLVVDLDEIAPLLARLAGVGAR